MPRKKLEDINTENEFIEEPVKEIVDNTPEPIMDNPPEEIEIPKVKAPVAPKKEKIETKVGLITKTTIILVDSEGNGISIPLTKENKNLKIGDTYYL